MYLPIVSYKKSASFPNVRRISYARSVNPVSEDREIQYLIWDSFYRCHIHTDSILHPSNPCSITGSIHSNLSSKSIISQNEAIISNLIVYTYHFSDEN